MVKVIEKKCPSGPTVNTQGTPQSSKQTEIKIMVQYGNYGNQVTLSILTA